jgi:Putative MetA-pathway of phenol degradation
MTTCRLPLLGLVLTALVSNVGWGQSQIPGYTQPSSRQTVPAQAVPASPAAQAATAERSNWLKRIVLGDSEKSQAKPASPQLSTQQPSSRQTSVLHGTTATATAANQGAASKQGSLAAQSPAAKDEKGNWIQRLMPGERDAAPPKTDVPQTVAFAPSNRSISTAQAPGSLSNSPPAAAKTVQFAAPQPSSRQAAAVQSPGTGTAARAQTAAPKPIIASNEGQPAANNERVGWLRRLVVGEGEAAGNSNSPSQPVANQSSSPRMMSGLFGPPQAESAASQPNTLAVQVPSTAHVPRALAGSPQDPGMLSNSLNNARASAQQERIEPDPSRSVSLTNWISRLRRSPAEAASVPPSNTLAPASVADRSVLVTNRQSDPALQPNPQSMASSLDANRSPAALAPTPNAAQMSPAPGLASAGHNATADSANSLTGWLSRPFRSADNPNKDLLAAQQSQSLSSPSAPVRLPAVSQTAARPSPNHFARLEPPAAPAGVGNMPMPGYGTPNADSASPVRFGSNVRLSAAEPSHSAMIAAPVNAVPAGALPRDLTNRVSPTTANQSAAPPMMMQPRPLPQASEHTSAMPLADGAYETLPSPDAAGNPLGRPKIIFNPVAGMNGRGQATLKPTVQVTRGEVSESYAPMRFAQAPEGDALPPPERYMPEEGPIGPPAPAEELPVGPSPDEWTPMDVPYDEPMTVFEAGKPFLECYYTVMAHLNGPRSCPPGIGVENVMNAPFWLDTTQPINNCRIRGDAAADWEFPDRIEYFWAKSGPPKGPQLPEARGEPPINYQEVSFYIERGGERFSVGTDIPIRAVDPVIRRNTTGLADMHITTKTVLLDGKEWQLTQVFHTHVPTGSFRRGTGNGHVSLEPGVAWRYKWSDVTYIHGDLTYWFPIAGDLFHSGQMLNYGIGISHIWIDGDKWALMPTLELNAWTVLDGRQTFPFEVDDPADPRGEIDTLSILNIHPGLRWVCDTAGDCGVREFGISSGFTVTEDHWYEEILRLEMRWVF